MAKIENHGLPTRATVGVKGDIYIDLDTGVKYECRGTYGFVDVDCVDEPVEYKWERVDAIDQSRLPESLQFGSVIVDQVLFDGEITVNDAYQFTFDEPINLKPGKKYNIAINGVEYTTRPSDIYGGFPVYPTDGEESSFAYIDIDRGTIFINRIGITDLTLSLKIYINNDEIITPINNKYLSNVIVPYVVELRYDDFIGDDDNEYREGYFLLDANSKQVSVEDLYNVYKAGSLIRCDLYGCPLHLIQEADGNLYFICYDCTVSLSIERTLIIMNPHQNSIVAEKIDAITVPGWE